MKNTSPQGAIAHCLLRRRQVEQVLGLSKSTIYARMNKNSPQYDPNFPLPIKKSATSIAFVESEINAFIYFGQDISMVSVRKDMRCGHPRANEYRDAVRKALNEIGDRADYDADGALRAACQVGEEAVAACKTKRVYANVESLVECARSKAPSRISQGATLGATCSTRIS